MVCRALVRASALSTYLAFQRLISSDDAAVARRRVMVARRPIFLLREREKEACYSLVMRLNYKVVLWILLKVTILSYSVIAKGLMFIFK